MAIDLHRLQEAASRFAEHKKAAAQADPRVVVAEKKKAAERHRKLFLPPAERLLAARTAVVSAIPLAPAATIGEDMLEPDAPLVVVGGVLPEIIQRDNDLRPMRFLQIGLLAARAVGRIRLSDSPVTEEGDATGFLVAPGLLMTNWHVLKTADFAAAASVIFDDEDEINGEPRETKTFMLRPDRLFVSDEKLDYALVEVAARTSAGTPLAQFGFLPLFEQTGKLDPAQQRQAANIVQHPGGGRKKIALRDNYILLMPPEGADPGKKLSSLFYGTDTLRGSSGSPVFSDQWYVIAVHRGGVPEIRIVDGEPRVIRRDGSPAQRNDPEDWIRYVTNEGTRVSRIYRSLRKKAKHDTDAALALERLMAVSQDPRLGPINLPTAPILLPGLPSQQEGGPEEITRRRSEEYASARGYAPTFLGARFRIPLPRMSSDVKRELAPLKNSTKTELKYDNYSVFMNRERRTAFFVAGNVNGLQLWNRPNGHGALPRRPEWSFDPRMDESFQPDDMIFSNSLQRGHLFKREDAIWGSDQQAMLHADKHSHTIPNATPMIRDFNNREWGDLEDIVTKECKDLGHRVTYFSGPIFRSTDPFYNELRRDVPPSRRRQGMRVPESFWKIVAWVEDSKLKAAGFILEQKNELEEHGPITEEINFGTYQKRPISEIEAATGLRFSKLRAVDTFQA
jgi:endonuclease G